MNVFSREQLEGSDYSIACPASLLHGEARAVKRASAVLFEKSPKVSEICLDSSLTGDVLVQKTPFLCKEC